MSEYGQVINPEYDPSKNNVFEAFSEYFENPILTKIKNVQNFSVYMTKIHAMLGNAYRYLIIFVEKDFEELGFEKHLIDCAWVSLQTRTLEDQHRIKPFTYKVRKTPALDRKISIVSRSETESIYESENFPLIITLLHTRKNNTYQYQPTGSIVSALETFQTIINFK